MAENESTSGLGWFLAGLGIGALVGVLYAPKSGKETREELVQGAFDAKEKASAKANEYASMTKEKAAELAEQARQLAAQGKQQVDEYVDLSKNYYEKGRTQWTEYVEKGKSLIAEQQDKVTAAIDAGKQAYVETSTDTQA